MSFSQEPTGQKESKIWGELFRRISLSQPLEAGPPPQDPGPVATHQDHLNAAIPAAPPMMTSATMASPGLGRKHRSTDGCWTCRLRRKKCDESKPECRGCTSLEIDCLYSETKPDWMDNGERQKERAEWLKTEVKRRADTRREKRYLHVLETGVEESVNSPFGPQDTTGSESSWQRDSTTAATPATNGTTPSPRASGENTQAAVASHPLFPGSTNIDLNEDDASMLMTYLDHVFPFLFPHYRPPMIDTGRGWLLVLLLRNKSLFHTALTLSSYYLSVTFEAMDGAHEACKMHNWRKLLEQQDLSLQEIHRAIANFNTRNACQTPGSGLLCAYPVLEAARLLGSIVQMLIFEVAIGNTGQWQIHLDAASELLDQMLTRHGVETTLVTDLDGETREQNLPRWTAILVALGRTTNTLSPSNTPWSVDQAALRFFTANLIQLDVLSATALEQAPRLHKWHTELLSDISSDSETHTRHVSLRPKELASPSLRLEEYVGLQNWIVTAIGDIASLAAWKKEMKRSNSLSIVQLVTRAAAIENVLRSHIDTYDAAPPPLHTADSPTHDRQNTLQFSNLPPLNAMSTFTSRVWAQAALTYLSVVVSGWQPASPEIRTSVDAAVALLSQLRTPTCLRTVVWPFFVTACLAGPEHEPTLRKMVANLGPIQVFGTVKEALAIIEGIWANRASIEADPDGWDLATCLRRLGNAALLV